MSAFDGIDPDLARMILRGATDDEKIGWGACSKAYDEIRLHESLDPMQQSWAYDFANKVVARVIAAYCAALSFAATRHTIIEALTTDLEREKAGTDALRKRIEGVEQAEREIEAEIATIVPGVNWKHLRDGEWVPSRGFVAGIRFALNALRREK